MEISALKKLCEDCKKIDKTLEELKEKTTEQNDKKTKLKKQILAHLEDNGIESFDFGVGKISISNERSVKLLDKYKFFEWLKEKGIFEDTISVNGNSLKSLYKRERERAEEDGDISFLTDGIPGVSEPSTFKNVKFYKK